MHRLTKELAPPENYYSIFIIIIIIIIIIIVPTEQAKVINLRELHILDFESNTPADSSKASAENRFV